MYIYPIRSVDTHYKPLQTQTFTAHPDFYKFNSTQSCYFRRGVVALANNKGYANIENLFCEIFQKNIKEPIKMLIIGIGNSQEVFSYLASIKGIIRNKQLSKYVDLYTVDLQSKPKYDKLRLDSFPDLYEYESFPLYAGKSFVKDNKYIRPEPALDNLSPAQHYIYMRNKLLKNDVSDVIIDKKTDYRVNDEILDFVNSVYNNSEKSKWDSRIQEVIVNYPNEKFDIISANNVFGYLSDKDYYLTIKHINRVLKTKRHFISDPYESEIPSNLKQLKAGIYQKL